MLNIATFTLQGPRNLNQRKQRPVERQTARFTAACNAKCWRLPVDLAVQAHEKHNTYIIIHCTNQFVEDVNTTLLMS